MKSRVVIEKEVGETPLMAIESWKREHPAYADTTASYAGRLDPMASGKLLVLLGDECKKQKDYTKLDKEYEIELLLDVGSDTGDALGLVKLSNQQTNPQQNLIARALTRERGTHLRPYPHFSSKTVDGKPLFLHTLEGTIGDIRIPEHHERIYRISNRGITQISIGELRGRIEQFLAHVPTTNSPSKRLGEDFRIDAVRASRQQLFASAANRQFTVISLRVVCGSGTYMRALVDRVGASLGTRGLALSIRRTKIGKFRLGLWIRRFV